MAYNIQRGAFYQQFVIADIFCGKIPTNNPQLCATEKKKQT